LWAIVATEPPTPFFIKLGPFSVKNARFPAANLAKKTSRATPTATKNAASALDFPIRSVHAPPRYDLKPGINSQFVHHDQISRNRFLIIQWVRPEADEKPDYATKHRSQEMKDSILSSLLTGIIGLLLGNRLRLGSESDARRRSFRNFISRISEEFKAAKDQELRAVHQSSTAKITSEAANISEDIRRSRRHGFDRAWRAYCDPSTKDFSKTDTWAAELSKEEFAQFKYELVRDQLIHELSVIKKYAA
jgi:hypothetical protein